MECKSLYNSGVRVYLLDSYNWIDFVVLSMYLSSYALRFIVDHRIKFADIHYNGTSRAREALISKNFILYNTVTDSIFTDKRAPTHSYFMKACRSYLGIFVVGVFYTSLTLHSMRTTMDHFQCKFICVWSTVVFIKSNDSMTSSLNQLFNAYCRVNPWYLVGRVSFD